MEYSSLVQLIFSSFEFDPSKLKFDKKEFAVSSGSPLYTLGLINRVLSRVKNTDTSLDKILTLHAISCSQLSAVNLALQLQLYNESGVFLFDEESLSELNNPKRMIKIKNLVLAHNHCNVFSAKTILEAALFHIVKDFKIDKELILPYCGNSRKFKETYYIKYEAELVN